VKKHFSYICSSFLIPYSSFFREPDQNLRSARFWVIVYFKSQFRTFFVYGFDKSDRANISQGELRWFKDDAKEDFALTDGQIRAWLKNGSLIEVF
jgi:hypothetical protein